MREGFDYVNFANALLRQTEATLSPESLSLRREDMKTLQIGINALSSMFGPNAEQLFFVPWPDTIEKCIIILDYCLSAEDKKNFKDSAFQDIALYHASIGKWMRNSFGLWQGNPALIRALDSSDPDHMSTLILEAYWDSLQPLEDTTL